MVQNGSQDGPKPGLRWTSFPKPLPRPFLVRFWFHLGSNLGPSWGHVGQKIDFWKFPKACKNDNDFQHSSGPSWDRFWNDLGVQNRTKIGPASVSSGSAEDFPRIHFVTLHLATPKSVAVKIGLKMDLKNDEKMAPRWGQNGVKNWFKIGFGNEVHLRPVLGPSWDQFWTIFLTKSIKHGVFLLVYVVK